MPPLGLSVANDDRLVRLVRYTKARRKGIDWMRIAKKLKQPLQAVRQQYFRIVAERAKQEEKVEETTEEKAEETTEHWHGATLGE